METILNIEDINLYHGRNHILKNINLAIPDKKIIAILGPSGCGKSTFLKLLNRMHDTERGVRIQGEVWFQDNGTLINIYSRKVDVGSLRQKIGMVFQNPIAFPKTIYENVAYGLRVMGIKDENIVSDTVESSLKKTNLWEEVKDRLKTSAMELSGGQQQRMCIARTLAVKPRVILMDEPTSALDPISTSKIMELMMELKESYSVILVTHDIRIAKHVSDKIAFFWLGEVLGYEDTTTLIIEGSSNSIIDEFIKTRFTNDDLLHMREEFRKRSVLI